MQSKSEKRYLSLRKLPIMLLGALSLFPFSSGTPGSSLSKGKRSIPLKSCPSLRSSGFAIAPGRTVASKIQRIKTECKKCGLCRSECGFLQKYGSPGEIVRRFDFSHPDHRKIAFECNLCGLCKTVCPSNLNMGALIIEVRKQAIINDDIDISRYSAILNYEKLGSSALFTFYGLPEGCDSVYFPGCAFAGNPQGAAWKSFEYLRKRDPLTGIVLDCCGKPSHDLGRQSRFESAFGKIVRRLKNAGVNQIIVNCPSCHETFEKYGAGFSVKTLYELIDGNLPEIGKSNEIVTVHDPCPMREKRVVQESVREMVSNMGFTIQEMRHSGNHALCCGEGGSVRFVRPEFAEKWKSARKMECGGKIIVTYCAACAENLNRTTPTVHVLDLLFTPAGLCERKNKNPASILAYIARLKLKHRFMKEFRPAANSR